MATVFETLEDTVWNISSNGFSDQLIFTKPTPDHKRHPVPPLAGSYGALPLRSVAYNEAHRSVHFERQLPTGEVQSFDGFLFDRPVLVQDDETGAEHTWAVGMAGTFTGSPQEDAARPQYGWFAVYLVNQIS